MVPPKAELPCASHTHTRPGAGRHALELLYGRSGPRVGWPCQALSPSGRGLTPAPPSGASALAEVTAAACRSPCNLASVTRGGGWRLSGQPGAQPSPSHASGRGVPAPGLAAPRRWRDPPGGPSGNDTRQPQLGPPQGPWRRRHLLAPGCNLVLWEASQLPVCARRESCGQSAREPCAHWPPTGPRCLIPGSRGEARADVPSPGRARPHLVWPTAKGAGEVTRAGAAGCSSRGPQGAPGLRAPVWPFLAGAPHNPRRPWILLVVSTKSSGNSCFPR